MKKALLIFVISLIAFSTKAQTYTTSEPMTFTALLNGAVKPKSNELQGYLISNGWTLVKSSNNDMAEQELWAHMYDRNTGKADMWLRIEIWFDYARIIIETFGDFTFGALTHEYLSKKIEQYCVYKGVIDWNKRFESDLVPPSGIKDYRKKYHHVRTGALFFVYNKSGTYYIEAQARYDLRKLK